MRETLHSIYIYIYIVCGIVTRYDQFNTNGFDIYIHAYYTTSWLLSFIIRIIICIWRSRAAEIVADEETKECVHALAYIRIYGKTI